MSKLVGLDGNPISSDSMHNPFKKQTIDDFPVLTQPELDEFYRAANQTLDQGIPLNIPTAMPLELLVRVAATLKHLSAGVSADVSAGVSAGESQPEDSANEVLDRVASLLQATKVLD
jgi:hypothetical protein